MINELGPLVTCFGFREVWGALRLKVGRGGGEVSPPPTPHSGTLVRHRESSGSIGPYRHTRCLPCVEVYIASVLSLGSASQRRGKIQIARPAQE